MPSSLAEPCPCFNYWPSTALEFDGPGTLTVPGQLKNGLGRAGPVSPSPIDTSSTILYTRLAESLLKVVDIKNFKTYHSLETDVKNLKI